VEDGFSLPAAFPTIRLDYLFANRELLSHLVECRVVESPPEVRQASDHLPVEAVFEWEGEKS